VRICHGHVKMVLQPSRVMSQRETCLVVVYILEVQFLPLWRCNCKEFGDDFQRKAFGLRHFEEHEDPSSDADDGKKAKHPLKAQCLVHQGEGVCYKDVTSPHCSGAYANANPTHTRWKDLRTQDIWNGTKPWHRTKSMTIPVYRSRYIRK
jgi:hypothetical protein